MSSPNGHNERGYNRKRKSRARKWRNINEVTAADYMTCRRCGKRTWETRARARQIARMHPEGARVYPGCTTGWHVTTSSDAVRTAYFKDPAAVRTIEDIPPEMIDRFEPEIMDLRFAGFGIKAIARRIKAHENVVAVILREHDPLAVQHEIEQGDEDGHADTG
jgi:hypothetical protein